MTMSDLRMVMRTTCTGNVWGDGNTLYFDCGSGSMATYICQNSYTCSPQFNYTSVSKNGC